MVGNLKMYLGLIDHDGERSTTSTSTASSSASCSCRSCRAPYALWVLRLVLIGALVLHLHAAYSLTVMNRRARPVEVPVASATTSPPTSPARTMRWTGIIVLLFLVWHLADFTWGWVNPDFVRGAVYRNLDASLSRLPVAILYIVANIALGIHLFHGTWSLFQSLGWNNPRFNPWRRGLADGHRHDHRGRQRARSRSPSRPASSQI